MQNEAFLLKVQVTIATKLKNLLCTVDSVYILVHMNY